MVGSLLGKNGSAVTQRGKSLGGIVGAACVAGVLVVGGCSSPSDHPSVPPTPPTPPSLTSGPSQSTKPRDPASTPVPPPTPGNVKSTLKPRKVERRKPVSFTKSGTAADGVIISLKAVKAIQAKGVGPGEVSGPALRVDVRVRNKTPDSLDLGGAVVALTDQDGRPGAPMGGPPASRLPGTIGGNKEASGVYVFDVARGRRSPVTIEVNVAGSMPTVVFRGKADG